MGTLYEVQYTFGIISRSVLLRIRNVLDKSCRENQNTFYIEYFFSKIVTVYEVMWENLVELDRPQIKTWQMSIASWVTEATNIHSQNM